MEVGINRGSSSGLTSVGGDRVHFARGFYINATYILYVVFLFV